MDETKPVSFEYRLLYLSDAFYKAYPYNVYGEIARKDIRPYNCLVIETHRDYNICIPYRSHINHPYAYLFRKSSRSKESIAKRKGVSGLDFTKMIIIANDDYLDYAKEAFIDQDEYIITRDKIDSIVMKALEYLEDYLAHHKGERVLHPREYSRKYQFSTLTYFHDILGLE